MHTTEHIINQTMIRLFGCGRSVEAHIERKKSKLDYRLEDAPTEEQVKQLEDAVNEVSTAIWMSLLNISPKPRPKVASTCSACPMMPPKPSAWCT